MRKETIPVDDQSSTLQSSDGPLPGSLALELQKEAPPAAVHPLGVMTSSPLRVTRSMVASRNENSSKAKIVNASPNRMNEKTQQSQTGRGFADDTLICSAPIAAEESQPPGVVVSQPQNERKMFLVFVKVLLKYLEKVNDDSLRKHAKAIIAECTVRNRNGDSDYLCLQGAVERRLQQNLGRWHWDRAQICYHRFLERCRMPSTIAVTSSACV
mmetsp:Transcript_10433/g.20006  ORF Transcript_10433/g.20006 Transcript_10433/m.20006 type:complete len:213 (-) Transcript_10433:125-763(-)